ncbi:alpha-glucosidase [Mollicutes bacterium LVI A0078]|nr:alpha-glucosidase [Mollicutes bacterium LVI A0075]WOO91448.1 alpha-glucosidase [Mollicutes bacterium LVI A0078]
MNVNNKVVYQIYPKSFLDTTGNGIGDIKGIIKKLSYIKDLGVDYIWLSPINESPQKDNGYDISDYYHIDPLFGTDDDYKQLISEANKLGLKVMLDLVLNHTSDQHEWFKKACNGDQEYFDYYVWTDKPNDLEGFFSSGCWKYVEKVDKYYLHLFDESQPDLNWHNPKVRQQLYKMINYWIDLGVEGFRLDVIDLIAKEPEKYITGKGPMFYEYLKELNNNTFKNKILTVGECWNSTIEEANKMCNENGLTEIFHFSHLTLTNGEDKWEQNPIDFNQVIETIKKWQNEYDGNQTVVMNNHDMPRLISLWLDDTNYRYESSTLLATLFGLLNGTQYIYQGEEVGFTNAKMTNINDYNDVETFGKYNEYKHQNKLSETKIIDRIQLISRDNARIPMAWDDSTNGGFTAGTPWLKQNENYSQINVENDLKSDKSVYKYYQEIIKFKKENFDKYIDHKLDGISYDDEVITYSKNGLFVICNMSENTKEISITGEVVFSNYPTTDELKPYQAIVYKEQ